MLDLEASFLAWISLVGLYSKMLGTLLQVWQRKNGRKSSILILDYVASLHSRTFPNWRIFRPPVCDKRVTKYSLFISDKIFLRSMWNITESVSFWPYLTKPVYGWKPCKLDPRRGNSKSPKNPGILHWFSTRDNNIPEAFSFYFS